MSSGMLENRNAIIRGGGGMIGGAVARAFAAEGARVHLCGRTRASLERVASDIHSSGGAAEVAVVDALDEEAVQRHALSVAEEFGTIDIAFCLIDVQDAQGTPMVQMSIEDYERPIRVASRSFFLTSKAVAPQMIRQRGGVILTFGGDGGNDPIRHYSIGGFQVALATADAMRRQLAAELGEFGIRVNTIHTGGLVETLAKDFPGNEVIAKMLVEPTMLGRTATLADVGRVAAFLASDGAASITGASLNITAGAVAD